MKIAVGSMNPVKITAVSNIVARVWPECTVEGVAVPSGVSDMPMSDEETIEGSKNRALAAREALDADFGFGLEGGVHPWAGGLLLMGWVAAVDKNGRFGLGGCGRLPLPKIISDRVLAGEELGDVMDDLLHDHNSKQKEGAVGALTGNLITRVEAFQFGVANALGRFVTEGFYDD
ncbi:MAG: inosine/xanthosine triphosphatase [Chloroflexota bacterium]